LDRKFNGCKEVSYERFKEKNRSSCQQNITIRDLAQIIDNSPIQIIKKLMNNGVMVSINQSIDFDTAAILADEMGFEAVLEKRLLDLSTFFIQKNGALKQVKMRQTLVKTLHGRFIEIVASEASK
jgi:hypothetical protein